jgi:hypothetical protein
MHAEKDHVPNQKYGEEIGIEFGEQQFAVAVGRNRASPYHRYLVPHLALVGESGVECGRAKAYDYDPGC